MKFKDIIGKKIAVHCKTKNEAATFMKMCANEGILWVSKGSIDPSNTYWENYGIDMCYSCSLNGLSYSGLLFFISEGYYIAEFSEIEDERKEKNMTTLEMLNAAKETNNIYVAGDMRYSKEKGFQDRDGRKWQAKSFDTVDEIFQVNNWHLVPKMTMKEIEKKLGYEFELTSE